MRLLEEIDEILINLQSEEKRHRLNSLKVLLKYCEDNNNIICEDIIAAYDKLQLFILKCYADKFESIRELACTVVTQIFQNLPENDYYLQYIISTITKRIGQKEIIEDCEEIRLKFLEQINFLIEKFHFKNNNSDLLLKSYDDIINILAKTLKDNYPAVQREACSCIQNLAEATPSFHYRAEVLVPPLISILHHKHSGNRIAAIRSLGIVALHITTNSDCVIQIITEISQLVMDTMPLVRQECGFVGCKMLLNLKDRYSLFFRIIPLVLCCLNDDSPDIRHNISDLWTKCGQQYYEENENELNKIEIIDDMPNNYPVDVTRPELGCRAIVQRSLNIVKIIMREVLDWKEEVRLHSLKLLWQIVLHNERNLTSKFVDIYPVLSKACADKDLSVSHEAIKVAELMGMLLEYNDWHEYAIDILSNNPKLGYLKCFYSLYTNSKGVVKSDIIIIIRLLARREFTHSLQNEFQEYMLRLASAIIDSTETLGMQIEDVFNELKITETNEIEKYLYHIIIKVMTLSYEQNHTTFNKGESILFKLAKGKKYRIYEFHSMYLNSVIETIECLDAENDDCSEPILLLHGIICICGFQKDYLTSLTECIQTVWNQAAADGKIKIFSAIARAMLNWNKTISLPLDESVALLNKFVSSVVVSHLTWKAGTGAESLRTLATASLCSMSQGAYEEAPAIFKEIIFHFPNLIGDNNVATRVYALRCVTSFCPLDNDHIRPVGYAILQRLDDPSHEVREWAARVICTLHPAEKADLNIWQNLVKQIFPMLFLHFESPEVKLKVLIKDAIVKFGKENFDIFRDCFKTAFVTASDKNGLDEILRKVKNSCQGEI